MTSSRKHGLNLTQSDNIEPVISGRSKVLLIEWSDSQALIAEATRGKNDWSIDQEFAIAWDDSRKKGAFAAERGRQLAGALQSRQIKCDSVVLSVPRRHAIMKLVTLSGVKPHMLADAVRLQAESRGQSQDDFVIDYLAQDADENDTTQVLVVAYPRPLIEEIQATMHQAGLEPVIAGLGDLGLSMRMPSSGKSHVNLLLVAETDHVQYVVNRDGRTISSIMVPLSPESDGFANSLMATLNRLLTALPKDLLGDGIGSIFVTGRQAQNALTAMHADGTYAAESLTLQKTGAFRAWGLAMAPNHAEDQVNLIRPKQSPDAKALKRQAGMKVLSYAGLSAVLVFLLFRFYLSQLDSQTADLDRERQSLTLVADSMEARLGAASELANWQNEQVQWSRELTRFLRQVPGNERVFLSRIRVEQASGAAPDIRIEGQARDLEDAFQLNQRLLSQSPRYRLMPDNIDRNDNDPHYKINFVVAAELGEESDSENEVNVVRFQPAISETVAPAETEENL